MQSYTDSRVDHLAYNPATRCFEALVTLTGEAGYVRVPCSLRAALDSDMGRVEEAMHRMARRHLMRGTAENAARPDRFTAAQRAARLRLARRAA